MKLTRSLEHNLKEFQNRVGADVGFDILVREIRIGTKPSALLMVDGFVKDDVLARIMQDLLYLERGEIVPNTADKLIKERIPYSEISTVSTLEEVVDQVLAGPVVMLVDGEPEAIVIDVRQYPSRSIEEPDLERVTRGSRDGFTETVVFNTALIRRRIRDPNLRIEMLQAGRRSKTDIAVAYVKDVAAKSLVDEIKGRIKSVDTDSLPMGSKTLEEYIVGKSPNPLPKVRFTERPDVAAAHLLEGHVLIIVDTTPAAMIVPANAWHFTQHAEEYFQHPVVGTYLRWVRFMGILISMFLTPLWLALALNPEILPSALKFIGPKETASIPLFVQFLFLELGLDLIRMALIHTPNALATSLGILGAILLGQLAVEVGLFNSETILYIAITAIGSFATPNLEFALAVRLYRLLILVSSGLFGLIGFAVATLVVAVIFAFTNSFSLPYLWPLIPLDIRTLFRLLVRSPVPELRKRPFLEKESSDLDTTPTKE